MKLADSGKRTSYSTGAVRETNCGKGRCDLLPTAALIRLSKQFERASEKYPERDWEKGLPIHTFMDSALRHIFKYLDGQNDEDHLCSAAWNILCAMWMEEKHPEMQDIPSREPSEAKKNTSLERYDISST